MPQKYVIACLYILGAIVTVFAFSVDVMEVDAAQYAALAMEMLQTGEYLEVFQRGEAYNSMGFPDKPPLLFWLAALGYKIFGIGNIGYKIASVISAFIGAYSLFRFTQNLYNKAVATKAVIIYTVSVAFLLMISDIRTDTLLTAWIIFAVWQLHQFITQKSWRSFFLGFTGIALAMLAKGPLGIMVPALAIGFHLILNKNFKEIFNWKWLLGIAWVLILLSPMLWGLYSQWGFENGIKYYFWTQSFGRITGENVWKNESDPFFFIHTFLWSALPWSLFGLAAFFVRMKFLYKHLIRFSSAEFYSLGGFLFPFIALSNSHFKLPHYIYVCLPFAAIFTANFIEDYLESKRIYVKSFLGVNYFLHALLFLSLALFITVWVFPSQFYWLTFLLSVSCVLVFLKFSYFEKTALLSLFFLMFMASNFYPKLLSFQATSTAGTIINESDFQYVPVYIQGDVTESVFALEFYSKQRAQLFLPEKVMANMAWVYTADAEYASLRVDEFEVIKKYNLKHYPVTHLNFSFLMDKQKNENFTKRYLFLIKVK